MALCAAGFMASVLASRLYVPHLRPLAVTLHVSALLLLGLWALPKRSLAIWIFWSMVAGLAIGLDAPGLAVHLRFFSDLFLWLIKMIMVPLILCVLIGGIAGHAGSQGIARLAIKSFIYFEILTTAALAIGMLTINFWKVGANLTAANVRGGATYSSAAQSQHLGTNAVVPFVVSANPIHALAENHVLQTVVFAILFGIALSRLSDDRRRPILEVLKSLTATMFQVTNLIMYTAPFAVGGALAYSVAHSGAGVMIGLGKLIAAFYCAIAAFIAFGMLPAALLARIPLRQFLIAIAEPAAIAFATSTSEAALPIAMENMEKFGVSERIIGFVIPTGYSFNLAGSALYLSLAAIFLAQAANFHLSWSQQIVMLGAMILTSKGVAGIPRAVFLVLAATAASFHLPVDMLPLLLGVDVIMDMGRAMINATGNCLASAVVARWEGELLTPNQPAN